MCVCWVCWFSPAPAVFHRVLQVSSLLKNTLKFKYFTWKPVNLRLMWPHLHFGNPYLIFRITSCFALLISRRGDSDRNNENSFLWEHYIEYRGCIICNLALWHTFSIQLPSVHPASSKAVVSRKSMCAYRWNVRSIILQPKGKHYWNREPFREQIKKIIQKLRKRKVRKH